MKRIMTLLIACACFACEKSEVMPAGESLAGSVTSRSVSSEVYVEDGYLVLKDLNTLDSINILLSEMTGEERLLWDKQMGYESAYSYFKSYFDAFDALETVAEMEAFQERYKEVLKVINDDVYCDVDYPFEYRGDVACLSKDGKVKIGNTLWIYKEDRKVTIFNATSENILKYSEATETNEEKGVYVDYFNQLNAPQTRAAQAPGYKRVGDAHGEERNSSRAYEWSLDYYPARVDGDTWTYLSFYQRGSKVKNNGNTKVISTTYNCTVNKLYVNGSNVVVNFIGKTITSPEGRGGRYFSIMRNYGDQLVLFSIELRHRSRGLEPKNPILKASAGTYNNRIRKDYFGKYLAS